MEITAPTILEIGAILLAAATAGWLARRVHLPAVVGYLAVGLAISPFTPGWVADPQQLHILADIGVVLLLFEVGIEIDLFDFRREQRGLVWAAPLQMVITTLVGVAVGLATGIGPLAGAVLGLAVAFSSSVVVLNITRSKRRRTDPPTEKALVGWAILQDVAGVVLFGFLLAALSAGERPWYLSLLGLAAFIGLAWVAAWVLPRALRAVHEDKDLFLVVTIGAGLALAGLGGFVFGIPMALAAFIAGLAISESHESAEARRRILPFRDLFAILFFVAVGHPDRPLAVPRGVPLAGRGPRHGCRGQGGGGLRAGPGHPAQCEPAPVVGGTGPDRRVLVRARVREPGGGRHRRGPVHRHPGRGGVEHRGFDRRRALRPPVGAPLEPA